MTGWLLRLRAALSQWWEQLAGWLVPLFGAALLVYLSLVLLLFWLLDVMQSSLLRILSGGRGGSIPMWLLLVVGALAAASCRHARESGKVHRALGVICGVRPLAVCA